MISTCELYLSDCTQKVLLCPSGPCSSQVAERVSLDTRPYDAGATSRVFVTRFDPSHLERMVRGSRMC